MHVFLNALEQMLVLFLLVLVGVLARKLRFTGDKFDALFSRLVVDIALPAMIIAAVLRSERLPDARTIGVLLLCSTCAYALVAVVALLVPRLYGRVPDETRGAHSFMIAFGNVGFMGLPVLGALFGQEAVLYGAICNIPFNVLMFSAGVSMVQGRFGCRGRDDERASGSFRAAARRIVNPCLVACLAAAVLALLGITDVEGVVGRACGYLGDMTLPASMIVIGSTLAKMPASSVFSKALPYVSAAIRLLGVPLLLYAVFGLFVTDRLVLGVLVVGSAMPVASVGTMLCLVHGGDGDTMTRGTFITTVLSVATLPLLAVLVS